MMTSWTLPSIPPHDWYICLDIDSYFDHEHEPLRIFEEGFTRPLPLTDRDILVTIHFNGDPEAPEFYIECEEELSSEEIKEANFALERVLGTGLDLRPLYDQAASDPVLQPKMEEYYGLKRMARASLLEDIINRIIQMQLSHKPTARKMVWNVRDAYGTHLTRQETVYPAWPRAFQLAKADPVQIRKLGPTLRKGEYLTELAQEIVAGNIDLNHLDRHASPKKFYQVISTIRGIGPTTAQDLMLFRNRTDAFFPPIIKKGEETGLRRWILMSYGEDPAAPDEHLFDEVIRSWKGYEAAAAEFLFADWVISSKKKNQNRSE
ncbi:MAG TPA: hypothetical protein VK040_03505 [Balneolaceae bacterium]|nr:hypothetical protein [Balneolaceae bacterium]